MALIPRRQGFFSPFSFRDIVIEEKLAAGRAREDWRSRPIMSCSSVIRRYEDRGTKADRITHSLDLLLESHMPNPLSTKRRIQTKLHKHRGDHFDLIIHSFFFPFGTPGRASRSAAESKARVFLPSLPLSSRGISTAHSRSHRISFHFVFQYFSLFLVVVDLLHCLVQRRRRLDPSSALATAEEMRGAQAFELVFEIFVPSDSQNVENIEFLVKS